MWQLHMTHAVKRASVQAHQPHASVTMTVTLVETAAVTLMTLALQVGANKSMDTAKTVPFKLQLQDGHGSQGI